MKNLFYNISLISNRYMFVVFLIVAGITDPGKINAQDQLPLKSVFEDHFLIGAALNQSQFSGEDTIAVNIVNKHFNTVTPENVLKWEKVHPLPDKYNFEDADLFVEFGEKHGMFMVGHTLVWHNQTPEWVFKDDNGKPADRELLLDRMKDHIHTVVGRYKGRIKGWDVVNEALNEDGSLRKSLWMEIIGEEYIEKAFEFAREADPDAELYYNDFSLENEPKREGAVALVTKLLDKGLKVTGIGTQQHLKMDWPAMEQVDSTINAFAEIGVKVMITELDMDVLPYAIHDQAAEVTLSAEAKEELNPYPDELPDSVQQELAARYADLFSVFVKNSDKISRVTFWGVTDNDSWLNNWPVQGRSNYPLLFDRYGNPKPAYNAVIKVVKK